MKTKNVFKLFIFVLIIALTAVMFAACASGNDASNDGKDSGGDGLGGSEVAVDTTERKIIFTYDCNIYTENLSETIDKMITALKKYKGYEESYSSESDGKTYASAQYTLRIKSEDLNSFLAELKKTGTVRNEKLTSTDVTKNYIDLAAQKEAKEAEKERLKDLMKGAANTYESMLISERMEVVQADINRIEASLNNYDSLVELSTVTVYLYETMAPVDEGPTFGQKLGDVFSNSGKAILTFFEYALYFLIYVLPFAVVGAGVVIPIVIGSKKRRKKYLARQGAYQPPYYAQQNAMQLNVQTVKPDAQNDAGQEKK